MSQRLSRRGVLQESTAAAAAAIAASPTGGKAMTEYQNFKIEKKNQVATIRRISAFTVQGSDLHWELGEAFSELRGDNSIRVIVLAGAEEGAFGLPPRT